MGIGPWEIVIILIILVVIFGAGRLSQISGAMGRSVREFKTAVNEDPKAAAPVEQKPAAPPVVCPSCQAANSATNKFCSACGATLQVEAPKVEAPALDAPKVEAPVVQTPTAVVAAETTCPSCATVNPPGQAFCGQCGTRLTRAA